MAAKKKFLIVLIKPSHYDSEGYVIQWVRSAIPSNTLAQLYALADDCRARQILGPDVEIEIEAYDETNRVIPLKAIAKRLKAAGNGFVGFVGVQSNQFPRAVDMARHFRNQGQAVVIGGFHVSGCLSMLPKLPDDIQAAQDMGITLFAGEAEGRFEALLRDLYQDQVKPLYNFMNDLPDLTGAIAPFLPADVIKRTSAANTSFDAGRGCPFQCSFCTIINVQGRKSRRRSPDDIEAIVRANLAQGVHRFFITDDNFARNKDWEPILDRLIKMREEEGLKITFIIQVDTLCHRNPRFIEKAARAGCKRVFIGLENINPDALMGAKKRQNKIWEYREMLQSWKDHGCLTYAGYILGFPVDTPESIKRDIEIIQRELPVDLLEFFCLTPLPGSEDHQTLYKKGVEMDPDMNIYDLEHVTTAHPIMSKAQWQQVYKDAWDLYYTDAHVETIMRRGALKGMNVGNIAFLTLWFYGGITIEGIHPLESGFLRRKVRSQRRRGLPLENPLIFYPKRTVEFITTLYRWGRLALKYHKIRAKVKKDPNRLAYMDEAMTPVTVGEGEGLEMMQQYGEHLPHTHGAPGQDHHGKVAAAE